ncbi:MAG: hypothetical protein VB024_08190 [Dysgonamonadaceae bacterium]|nr:hypothetical protein [Dysgonamonadaceae bacterium]
MKPNEITRVIEQLKGCCKKKPSYLTSSQIFDGIVHIVSLYILSKNKTDIATTEHRDIPPTVYIHNLKFRDEIVNYLNSIKHNFDELSNTQMEENVVKNAIENVSRSAYLYLLRDILQNEYQITIDSSIPNISTLNISYFEEEINNCKIENLVDSSQFYGDRRKISYIINRFYDLNKISVLKQYYANCQHPYVNWTFQFISSIYGDKIEYLQRVFKRFSNMDFSSECYDADYMYGYAFSLLAVIDLSDKSRNVGAVNWWKLLGLAYLFLTQFVLVSKEKRRNIMVSDAYSNRARLMHAYQDDFNGIFFSVSGAIDVRFNYVSDKYLAFVVGEDNPFREDFHKDALMMYQNGSVKKVTGNGLTMGGDGTFQDVVNGGIFRSKQLYSFLFDSFINGKLYLTDSEIDWIFSRIREKWLVLKPIYPSLLNKELGN